MDLIESMDSSTIRVDKDSKTGSVMDTIRILLKCNSGAANTYLSRLFATAPELTTRCGRLKINGKGNLTPVADAKTLIEIVWLLPGNKAHAFRHQSSEKVQRERPRSRDVHLQRSCENGHRRGRKGRPSW